MTFVVTVVTRFENFIRVATILAYLVCPDAGVRDALHGVYHIDGTGARADPCDEHGAADEQSDQQAGCGHCSRRKLSLVQ